MIFSYSSLNLKVKTSTGILNITTLVATNELENSPVFTYLYASAGKMFIALAAGSIMLLPPPPLKLLHATLLVMNRRKLEKNRSSMPVCDVSLISHFLYRFVTNNVMELVFPSSLPQKSEF